MYVCFCKVKQELLLLLATADTLDRLLAAKDFRFAFSIRKVICAENK